MITPAMIEKAARARWIKELFERTKTASGPDCGWSFLSEREKELEYSRMRAALISVLPDIIEECAKVADQHYDDGWNCFTVAAAIRALGKE